MFSKAFTVAAIVGLAVAAPVEQRATGTTSKEFSLGGCRDILFAWARGSTEIGNMVSLIRFPHTSITDHTQGTVVGPPTSDGLKRVFGETAVATEGIDYAANVLPNTLPGGTDAASRALMQRTLNDMHTRCPDSVIVTGGYSQGAAVNHRAIESLSQDVKDQIAGVILYGDTQRLQVF